MHSDLKHKNEKYVNSNTSYVKHLCVIPTGMGSSRTVLDLEDSSRTKSRGLGLVLGLEVSGLGLGIGLEHSVLEHIHGLCVQRKLKT